MQEIEKTDKRSSFSKSKAAMVLGIVVLLGVIGFLVYLSQPTAHTAQAPGEEVHKRTKESIGVYSRLNSGETEATAPKDKPGSTESEQSVAAEKRAPVAEKTAAPATEKTEAPVTEKTAPSPTTAAKTEPPVPVQVLKGETTNAATSEPVQKAPEKLVDKTAKVAAPHHKKHHRSEETFFELAPNSGKHSPDNLDRVAN